MIYWLVVSTPLKNISQLGVGMMIPNLWKNKKWSKPPTSLTIELPRTGLVALVGIVGPRIELLTKLTKLN